jgi:hypothetical protein
VDLSEGNFYLEWRQRTGSNFILRDAQSMPPEVLLQAVWHHQRLQRDSLKTMDGRAVRVLHPGFLSVTGGPDFRGAIIQFDQDPPVSGDIEVDLHAHNWRAHHHDLTPTFKNVILHVVWAASDDSGHEIQVSPAGNAHPPVLVINHKLDAPLMELNQWLELTPPKVLPQNLLGLCSVPLKELDQTNLNKLLRSAARVRFEQKAAAIRARAQAVGWEQALWENLFRALGYKQNIWPMQNLAESRPTWMRGASSAFAIQTRLLGIGCLLPVELARPRGRADGYVRRAWDAWWREADEFRPFTLPRDLWKFNGLRPANQPQRRLALAAHWLASSRLIADVENWCVAKVADTALCRSLHEILMVESDEFWSWHWTLHSARMPRPQPLLGEARVTDLAINVILPWLWVRAVAGGNRQIQTEMERRFFAWPCAADNSVLKFARQRLLGTTNPRVLADAASQQGLMQITRDFCDYSDALCTGCQFPKLVKKVSVTNKVP